MLSLSPTPDDFRLLMARPIHGPNYWSRQSVTRLDIAAGVWDYIPSNAVPGLTEALVTALPGLIEHRCSVGERGGFIQRLRRGTYLPHIIEHVGLELQIAIGHDVGFGRARGGDRPGEYTVVFQHLHTAVGTRAATLAVQLVRDAFRGSLSDAGCALEELSIIAETPEPIVHREEIDCGITGGAGRAAVRREIHRHRVPRQARILDVRPSELLESGLPYTRSRVAVILDACPRDVPWRYREPDRARQLVSVLADGVPRDGYLIVPAEDPALTGMARESGCRPAVFSISHEPTREVDYSWPRADVHAGRIIIRRDGKLSDEGPLNPDSSIVAQVAGSLAAYLLRDGSSTSSASREPVSMIGSGTPAG
ncbi:MAG: hypothetical protein LBG44_01075 [Gemmatimonadota bacterium]|jgi:cyanophycin synthetase|nr:hypothetical protein [Gemmatimonadota bacterium]